MTCQESALLVWNLSKPDSPRCFTSMHPSSTRALRARILLHAQGVGQKFDEREVTATRGKDNVR